MTANSLIDLTLKEIAKEYRPEILAWMKANRPNKWGKMLTFERRINGMALGGNLNSLRGALNEYQSLILAMVKEFKSLNEKKGQGMFNF
jgi:hypothetical protein